MISYGSCNFQESRITEVITGTSDFSNTQFFVVFYLTQEVTLHVFTYFVS